MKKILLFIALLAMSLIFLSPGAWAQQNVMGKVVDQNNEGLIGVSVTVKGTTRGVITGADGNFTIDAQPDQQLVFSYIGYQTQTLPVGNRTQFNITLAEDAALLNEVVVVGYGVTRKSDLTSAVGQVDAKQLEDLPTSRVDQALQGRAAGVMVTSNNGSPGARSSIRIRGGNSVNADNEPLYVIDGFIVGTDFNLNNLNTNDIESIDVLKDATAISIYGTRGANGVILITTKTGKGVAKGKPRVSANFYTGVQTLARKIDYLDGPERIAYGKELAEFAGEADPFSNPAEFGNTDWQDEVTQAAPIYNGDISVAGQTDGLNYYVSANIFDQKGILKSTGIKRYNLRTNLDFNLSKNIRAGIRLNGSFTNTENGKSDLWSMREVLTAFPIYKEDGSYWDENIVTGGVLRNPVADYELRTDFTQGTNLLTTAYVEFNPIPSITVRSTIGPKINWYKRNEFDPGRLPQNATAQLGGVANINSGFGFDILQENTISWNKEFNQNNRLDLLGGFTWQKGNTETFSARTQGISIDALAYDDLSLGDPLTYRVQSNFNDSRQLVSWLGRANYAFMNKYLFTLVGRVDGASVYSGSNNAYAFFPSAAVAWRIIDEPYMKNQRLFSNLKLRTSYGSAGKESIDPYNTLAVLNNGIIIFNDTQAIGIRRGRPANPDLKWETTDQLDVGLEFGFLDNRITGEIDYYYKKTRDLLLARQIPRATGFNTKLENIGSIQNQGLELMINSVNVNKENFRWESTLTLSGNRSKVLNIAGVDEINIYSLEQGGPGAKLIVGQPVGVFTGVQYLGTYKSQEEIDADGNLGIRQVVGGPRFKDENGDGKINNDDHVVMGNPEPLFFGGINNSFSYKNLSLDIFLQGTYGNDVYNEFVQRAFFGRSTSNYYGELANRWTPQNPTSDIPRAGSMISIADIRSNSAMLEDGSHLRLKNIRLSYNLPLKTKAVRSVSVYMVGSNLFLASSFRGYDPEANRLGTNSTVRGIIRGEYPNAKSVTFGVKANF
ncbi:SusC/RagA family TonB-linked outer membrane protein [Persicitalea jodogahamensis]|uniref:SusC/RagA family TonB-linked outer membrane protein n=1 Tax=Persicitalea jodogahamensis TaxID=402147 RepID=A0A8J3GBY3_9BACT|nr:TonB-dependent receptor [Persicitalea jodogahamensis]GHB84897.1 SusC/RagA family TonB-linked outer membrane protein [Persicitalea jodogahamensis]